MSKSELKARREAFCALMAELNSRDDEYDNMVAEKDAHITSLTMERDQLRTALCRIYLHEETGCGCGHGCGFSYSISKEALKDGPEPTQPPASYVPGPHC